METLRAKSAFGTETGLPTTRPHTPPYTPHRTKRQFERNDSPAPSVHPTETSSPAKKLPRLETVTDNVTVEELVEGDIAFLAVDLVYPEELEEVDTESDESMSCSDSDNDAEHGLARRLSRLRCGDNSEVVFEQERRRRHQHRRTESRLWKRTHSQSVKSHSDASDTDAMDDHDNKSSQRRLRRRTLGPTGSDEVVGKMSTAAAEPRSSPNLSVEDPVMRRPMTPADFSDDDEDSDDDDSDDACDDSENEAMELDRKP